MLTTHIHNALKRATLRVPSPRRHHGKSSFSVMSKSWRFFASPWSSCTDSCCLELSHPLPAELGEVVLIMSMEKGPCTDSCCLELSRPLPAELGEVARLLLAELGCRARASPFAVFSRNRAKRGRETDRGGV